jgi:lauroyl/myristoyl acyltransferase
MRLLDARDLFLLMMMALVKTASWLPSSTMRERLITAVSRGAYYLRPGTRLRAERNVSKAFDGDLSEDEVHRIVKESARGVWAEPFSLLPSRAELHEPQGVRVHGVEHLHRALANGKGVILWESAFGRRVLPKRVLNRMGLALHQIHSEDHIGEMFGGYGPSSWVRQHVLRPFFDNCEKEFVAEIIYLPSTDSLAFTRLLLRRLNENAILVSSAEGFSGQKLIPLEFLGQTRVFATGMVSLARMSGAPILPMFCIQERGCAACLTIEPPIEIQPGVSRERALESALSQYIRLLESYIRRYPEQYRDWRSVDGSKHRAAKRRRLHDTKRGGSGDRRVT